MVTSLEITSRPQLYFSSRPKEAAKPAGWGQDQLQWLRTPAQHWPISGDYDLKGPMGELMNILLTPSPDASPKIPHCKREIKASRQKGLSKLSPLGSSPCHSPSLLLPSLVPPQARVSYTLRQWAAGSLPQPNPQTCPQDPLFSDFPVSSGSPAQALLLLPLC